MFLFLLLYTNTFSYLYPDCVSNQLASPGLLGKALLSGLQTPNISYKWLEKGVKEKPSLVRD